MQALKSPEATPRNGAPAKLGRCSSIWATGPADLQDGSNVGHATPWEARVGRYARAHLAHPLFILDERNRLGVAPTSPSGQPPARQDGSWRLRIACPSIQVILHEPPDSCAVDPCHCGITPEGAAKRAPRAHKPPMRDRTIQAPESVILSTKGVDPRANDSKTPIRRLREVVSWTLKDLADRDLLSAATRPKHTSFRIARLSDHLDSSRGEHGAKPVSQDPLVIGEHHLHGAPGSSYPSFASLRCAMAA
jgi:hypothetical protein